MSASERRSTITVIIINAWNIHGTQSKQTQQAPNARKCGWVKLRTYWLLRGISHLSHVLSLYKLHLLYNTRKHCITSIYLTGTRIVLFTQMILPPWSSNHALITRTGQWDVCSIIAPYMPTARSDINLSRMIKTTEISAERDSGDARLRSRWKIKLTLFYIVNTFAARPRQKRQASSSFS